MFLLPLHSAKNYRSLFQRLDLNKQKGVKRLLISIAMANNTAGGLGLA